MSGGLRTQFFAGGTARVSHLPLARAMAGFSLIEMIVSLGIFGVVTSFVMANYRGASRNDALRIASQFVAGEVRRAQTLTVSGQSMSVCLDGTRKGTLCPSGNNDQCGGDSGLCVRSVPPGGYGLYFNVNVNQGRLMTVFADVNGDGLYQPEEKISTSSVSPDVFVTVDQVNPDAAGQMTVVFRPPNASAWFNGLPDQLTASVRLNYPNANIPAKYVRVNAISGQISAD